MWWLGFADQTPTNGAAAPSAGAAPPVDPALEAEVDDGLDVNEVVLRLLPWGVSILLHAGIILLAIFIVWSAIDRSEEEHPIIPFATLSKTPGAPVKMQTVQKMKQASSSPRHMVTTPTNSRAVVRSAVTTQSRLVGVRRMSGASSNPFRSGIGTGTDLGVGFFGTGGNARRIIYLIDASGSLMDTLDFVIIELKRSINGLVSEQVFTVIFFQGAEPIEVPVPHRGMKPATTENKTTVIEWIDPEAGHVYPMMAADPIPALKLALQYKPELVFILSDNITGSGRYEVDQRRLLSEVEKANTAKTVINTIQFIYRDTLEQHGLTPTLEQIADRSGGIYKFVDAKEVGIE